MLHNTGIWIVGIDLKKLVLIVKTLAIFYFIFINEQYRQFQLLTGIHKNTKYWTSMISETLKQPLESDSTLPLQEQVNKYWLEEERKLCRAPKMENVPNY